MRGRLNGVLKDKKEFPGGPVVRTLYSHCLPKAQVQSLVRELRFQKPHGVHPPKEYKDEIMKVCSLQTVREPSRQRVAYSESGEVQMFGEFGRRGQVQFLEAGDGGVDVVLGLA